jgi:iron complex outermembrane recepter protein
MKSPVMRRATIALLGTSMLATTSAFAQEAEEAPASDEIIVTAQKRSENLQNVPISIQALGEKKLDQLGVDSFNDFTKQLASVAFQTTQPGSTTVYMRGVASGGDGNHSGSLPSVGFYLDEQPVTTIGGTLDVQIYDIARIESLAGPQGTLYGASSQAGTIRIITNKPDASAFAGSVDAELNTVRKGGVGGQLQGMVNAPLSDNAALRVVGWYTKRAGFIDNVAATRSFLPNPGGITVNNAAFVDKNVNEQDVYGARAALKVDLDDNWTVTPAVMYQKMKNKGSFGFDPSQGDLNINRFSEEIRRDKFVQAALTIEGKIGNWDLTYAGAYLDRKTRSFSDYTDYAEAYDALYASYGGLADYFYFENAAGVDIDPRQYIDGGDSFKKLSQELRISSPTDKPLRVVGGLFYQRQTNRIFQDYLVPGLAPNLSVNGRPGTLWLTLQKRADKDYAAFGEVSFDIAPTLTVTAGGRYFKYNNSLIGFFGFGRNPGNNFEDGPPNAAGSNRTGVAQCFTASGQRLYDRDTDTYATSRTLLPAAVAGGPCTNLADYVNGELVPKRTKDDGFIHRLNLTWKPSSQAMLYGTWSRGFRPGGINRRSTIPPYQADFLTNFELGWKTSPADGLRLNGAIYLQNWKKFQYAFLGENSFTQIQNGPNARIKGIEVDLNYNAGNGFTFGASAALTDAKIRQNLCSGAADTTVDCSASAVSAPVGTRLPITPKFKGSALARYEFDLASGKAHFQANVGHQSSASSDIRVAKAAALGRLQAYTTVDFSAGIDWNRYSLEVFFDNAFDERGEISRFQQCGQCDQRIYIVPTQPRTIGIRAGAKF